jgi:hypothetical protein
MSRFTLALIVSVGGCYPCWRSPSRTPENQTLRQVEAAVSYLLRDDVDQRQSRFMELTPAAMDLAVRALAAIYWCDGYREPLGVSRDLALRALTFCGTDRALDELLRIARYADDQSDVNQALRFVLQGRRIELVPTLLEIADRQEIAEDIRARARREAGFVYAPLTFETVIDELQRAHLLATLTSEERRRCEASGARITIECMQTVKGIFRRPDIKDKIVALRRCRDEGSVWLVVPRFGAPRRDERAVLRFLQQARRVAR